jgi:hypothetical protein
MSKFADIAPRIWAGVATPDELASIKAEDVYAIKSDAEHVRVRASTTRKSADKEARTVEHVASDETPDRMGDVIRVKGWQLDNFLKNPVLLRHHNNEALPLGIVTDVRKGRADGRAALLANSQFFEDEKQDEAGRILARLVLDGDMPAVSVGFMPLKVRRPEDEAERKELGVGEYGVLYESAELLELSVVTVPANPAALMRRLDSMVEAGEVEKSLAAMVAKTFEPSSRVVVPVAKVAEVAPSVVKDQHGEALERIERSLAELKTTFSAELAALKGQLEIVSRGVSSLPAPVAANADTQTPAPDSRSVDPQAFFSAAFDAVLSRSKGAQRS